MSNVVLLIILAVASYLLGSVNWALLISKMKKKDIRKVGSGNPGTLNMSRNFGLKLGLLTFFLDIMKGVIPTLVSFFVLYGRIFDGSDFQVYEFGVFLCGFCAVLGHIFPIYFKFKGGKGIATTIGVMTVCVSLHGIGWASVLIMSLVSALLFIYFTEFGAMGSFIAITPPAVCSSIRLSLLYSETTNLTTLTFYIITNVLIFLIYFFTWFAHRSNIKRMLAGEEHPTSIKQMFIKRKAKKLIKKQEAQGQITNTDDKNKRGIIAEQNKPNIDANVQTEQTIDNGK